MKIYLIRHGQTTGDIEDRYGGDYDDHLTDLGKKQSQEMSKGLKGKEIEIIFSSPRIRAKETASVLGRAIRRNVEVIDDLRERNAYGVLTGLTKQEARQKYPDLVERVNDYRNTVTGGEPYSHFKNRIMGVMDQIVSKPYGTVAVVTHGGPIRCIFREILKLGELEDLKDCAVFELETVDGEIKLIK